MLFACLSRSELRSSLWGVVKAFFQRQILTIVALLYAYIALVVFCLMLFGLWNWDQLKNTLILSVAIGIVSIFRLPNIGDDPRFYRHWIADNFKIVVLVEFVVAFYTFHIVVELLLVPILALVGGMLAIGERDGKYSSAVSFLNNLLASFGAFLVGYAIYMIVAQPTVFWSWQAFRDFCTPIVLSFLLLPFIQIIHIYVAYERVFTRLDIAISDEGLRSNAKWHAVRAFGLSVRLLNRWSRDVSTHRPNDKQEIDRSIREVLEAHRRERRPPAVASSEGWSPNIAKEFLHDEGLVTGDYRRQFDEWYASSPYLEIGEGLIPNNIAYYVEGDERIAKCLKLILNINNQETSNDAEQKFLQLAQTLVYRAIGDYRLPNIVDFREIRVEDKDITLNRVNWVGGTPSGYDMKFKIKAD